MNIVLNIYKMLYGQILVRCSYFFNVITELFLDKFMRYTILFHINVYFDINMFACKIMSCFTIQSLYILFYAIEIYHVRADVRLRSNRFLS